MLGSWGAQEKAIEARDGSKRLQSKCGCPAPLDADIIICPNDLASFDLGYRRKSDEAGPARDAMRRDLGLLALE